MKISSMFRAALAALALLALPLVPQAQTVTQQPQFAPPRTVVDVGNGPIEFKMLSGSMAIYTSMSSGVAGNTNGTSSTTLALATTPTTLPCVGCVISAPGITAGTTISAINSGPSFTLSAAMTVATSATLLFGVACPSTAPTTAVALVQASVGGDLPFYTGARVCAYGGTGPGGQFVTFAIGAH